MVVRYSGGCAVMIAALFAGMAATTALAVEPDEASTVHPPLPVAGTPVPATVTAYALPRQDRALLGNDDSPERTCPVQVDLQPDGSFVATALESCPPAMVEPVQAAMQAWGFGGAEEPTRFQVQVHLRYSAQLATTTLFASVDPGAEAAADGLEGKPGLQLVHPPVLQSPLQRKVPGKARKAGVGATDCVVRVLVGQTGRAAMTEPVDCPEALVADAQKRVSKSKWTPLTVDGLPDEGLVDVTVRYTE